MERIRWKLIACIFIYLIIIKITLANELQKSIFMGTHHATLWQAIEGLIDQASLSPDKIRRVLPVDFLTRRRSAYATFYEAGPIELSDQVNIETIDLRVKHRDETIGMLVLDIAPNSTCITLDDVHARYPDMAITSPPPANSLNAKTYWSIQREWGELSFGFKVSNPHCLASIVLDRADPATSS